MLAALYLAVALSPESTAAVPEAPIAVEEPEAAAAEAPAAEPTLEPALEPTLEPTLEPAAAPEPALEPEPEPEPTLDPAPDPASITMPRRRGIGLLISAGVLATAGFPLKITAATSDRRLAGEIDRGEYDTDECVESCYVGPLFNVISTPMLFSSAALMGGGLNVYGRWAAHRDVRDGRPHRARRTGVMTGVGLGLIGAGIATFIGSRFALRNQSSAVGYVAIRELGWWGALAGVYSGAGLAGLGMGYRAGRRDAEAKVQTRIAPVISSQFVGLGISGSF